MNTCPVFQSIQGEKIITFILILFLIYLFIFCLFRCYRGENLMACWAIRELNNDPDSCVFEWLLCLDLKGRFPRFVLDKVNLLIFNYFFESLLGEIL